MKLQGLPRLPFLAPPARQASAEQGPEVRDRVTIDALPAQVSPAFNHSAWTYRMHAGVVHVVGGFVGGALGARLPFEDRTSGPLARLLLKIPRTAWDTPEVVAERQRKSRFEETLQTYGGPTSTMQLDRPQFRTDLADRLYGTGAARKERQAFILLGMPACGKSTLSGTLAEQYGALSVDADLVRDEIPEFDRFKSGQFVRKEKDDIRNHILERATASGDNVILSYVGKLDRQIPELQALKDQGYTLHLMHLQLPLEQVVHRSLARFEATGRLADPADVVQSGDKPASAYEKYKHDPLFATYAEYSADVPKGAPLPLLEQGENAPLAQPALRQAVAATRADGGAVNREAAQALAARLPRIDTAGLTAFAGQVLHCPVRLESLGETGEKGRTAVGVHFVTDLQGKKLAVLKQYADDEGLAREVSALQRLEGHVQSVHALAAVRTPDGPALLMTLAPGHPIDDGVGRMDLTAAVRGAGAALAALHTQDADGTPVPSDVVEAKIASFQRRADRVIDKGGLDGDRVRQYCNRLIDDFRKNPGPAGLQHGDAHLGNFLWSDTDGITVIDAEGVHKSMDGSGRPIGTPARDVAQFHQRLLERGLEAGLPTEAIAGLQQNFLEAYRTAGGPSHTAAALRFFEMQSALQYLHSAATPDAIARGVQMVDRCMDGNVQSA